MNEKRKREESEEKSSQRVARGCPSVLLPLTEKQRAKFLDDMRGWLPDWGDNEWQWLEKLLDSPMWSKNQRDEAKNKSGRGFGFAMDQLTGASSGNTNSTQCQWTRIRDDCVTMILPQSLASVEKSIYNTGTQALLAQMEEMRKGNWVDSNEIQYTANGLFEAARRDMFEELRQEEQNAN